MSDKAAAAGTAASWLLTVTAWLAQVEILLRVGATLVSIVAGLCAARYYWKKAGDRR